jgi:hypothetical protein
VTGDQNDDDERGWNLHYREKQHELAYRVGPGEWRKHRVPRSVVGDAALERYCTVYVETKRRQGFLATAPPKLPAKQAGAATVVATFGDFADDWVSGKLHRQHPDHVRLKRSADDDRA